MKEAFIAKDGKVFDSREECRKHENQLVPLRDRAHEIMNTFDYYSEKFRSDKEELKQYREQVGCVYTPQHVAVILYLRDDAVDVLIARIRELENES